MMTLDHGAYAELYAAVYRFHDAPEEYERIIRRVYERVLEPGDCAVDVGAHSGKHTLPLALAVGVTGSVVAFEPIESAYEVLTRRIRTAGLDDVITAVHGCASSSSGTAVFSVVPDHLGWSSLHPREVARETVDVETRTFTIDEVCAALGRVRFVKIDVEGAEPDVLAGASGTIESDRPIVHVEVVDSALAPFGYTTVDVARPLWAHGYRIFDILGNEVTDASAWAASSTAPDLADYIAIHRDDPALDVVRDELERSFLAERSDPLNAPPGLDLPPIEPRVPSAQRARVPASPLSRRHHTVLGSDVPSTVWPSDARASTMHELLVASGGWAVLDPRTGAFETFDSPARLSLPIEVSSAELPSGTSLLMSLDVSGLDTSRQRTLVEVHWESTGHVTLFRVRRGGRLEIVWLHGDHVVSVAGEDGCATQGTFHVELLRVADRVEASVSIDDLSLRTVLPARRVGDGRFGASIGQRLHSVNIDALGAESVVADFSLTTLTTLERLASEGRRLVRAARRGPRSASRSLGRRISSRVA